MRIHLAAEALDVEGSGGHVALSILERRQLSHAGGGIRAPLFSEAGPRQVRQREYGARSVTCLPLIPPDCGGSSGRAAVYNAAADSF